MDAKIVLWIHVCIQSNPTLAYVGAERYKVGHIYKIQKWTGAKRLLSEHNCAPGTMPLTNTGTVKTLKIIDE